MCDDCWGTAKAAAGRAQAALEEALGYFEEGPGLAESSVFKPEIAASHGAVAGVLMRTHRGQPRATEADVDALEKAQSALVGMSLTSAAQTKPYRDYSEDQLQLGRAISKIHDLWNGDPASHPTLQRR